MEPSRAEGKFGFARPTFTDDLQTLIGQRAECNDFAKMVVDIKQDKGSWINIDSRVVKQIHQLTQSTHRSNT